MTPTRHLAIDLGATSGRAILATFDGERVESEEIRRFSHPMLPLNDHIYWNLPGLYHEILEALRTVGRRGISLDSIGIDSWGCDVVAFRADGLPAGLPHCYRDARTEGAPERFFERMAAKELYSRTGIQVMDFNTVFQLSCSQPDAELILWIPDALAYMLTGKAVTEYTVASTSGMVNAATGELDDEILRVLGLGREKFGPLVQPGTLIGCLTPQVAKYCGIGEVPLYAVAGHDTASAVIAVPAEGTDHAYLSCGTWSLLGVESESPVLTEEARALNFTNEGGIDGSIRLLKNICGLWLLEQSRGELHDAPTDIAALTALYEHSDCDSIINPDDPCFAHPASMTAAIRDYCRRTSQAEPETTADYVRVIFRSLARRYREVLDMLRRLGEKEINRLHVIGGGSRNSHLMQLTADTLGIPVIAGPAESTALGNVLMQLRGCRLIKDRAEMRRIGRNSVTTKTYTPTEQAV
ncbi:MAG: rhamnulokinase [Muribaculaceae bacterium]|nr:rhamnulokinase [Muribaculaceae bacterium]